MYACESCGEEFETLSRLRVKHRPCPVEEEQRRQEDAIQRLKAEWGLEMGDWCRVIASGEEVEIVGIEPGGEGDDEPQVVWVPAGKADTQEQRQRSPAGKLV